jgi:photoactive yellow protein
MPPTATCALGFADIRLADLEGLAGHECDALPFGVIGLSAEYLVEIYNETESRLAGLSRDKVMGSHFFLTTAQCMNNFMVAQRFEDEAELDTIIDFVLTLRMRPTPVRLRLLQNPGVRRRYILLQRAGM